MREEFQLADDGELVLDPEHISDSEEVNMAGENTESLRSLMQQVRGDKEILDGLVWDRVKAFFELIYDSAKYPLLSTLVITGVIRLFSEIAIVRGDAELRFLLLPIMAWASAVLHIIDVYRNIGRVGMKNGYEGLSDQIRRQRSTYREHRKWYVEASSKRKRG